MAVTNLERAADPEVFDDWICDVRSAAKATQGFVAFAASISRDAPLDWAVAVTFESEDLLHLWLDGATWKHLVRAAGARGFLRLTSDLVIVDGAVIPSGVAIVSSSVSNGMEADLQAAHVKLTTAAFQFPGYEGTAIFRPGANTCRSALRTPHSDTSPGCRAIAPITTASSVMRSSGGLPAHEPGPR